ncbi:hypothetical protein [Jannaschia sp. LMIT008]|uniref:hypothetical protein n=1 Tax=Jannaschia maritima TaxID=3032585 RepID=UPI002811AB67|nr:hypothetical protein [Jannaschia sp. LMIT008]
MTDSAAAKDGDRDSKIDAVFETTIVAAVALAALMLFLAPTAFGAAILLYDATGSEPAIELLQGISVVYGLAAGAQVEFIRDLWVAFPALIAGLLYAWPRSQRVMLGLLALLMLAVAIGNSVVLEIFPHDPDSPRFRSIVEEIADGAPRAPAMVGTLAEQLKLTRSIAVPFVMVIVGRTLAKGNRRKPERED